MWRERSPVWRWAARLRGVLSRGALGGAFRRRLSGFRRWLSGFRPRCPSCGQRTLATRSPAAAFDWDLAHAAPAYFQCESCGSRFKSTDAGPLESASGRDDDRHFRPGGR